MGVSVAVPFRHTGQIPALQWPQWKLRTVELGEVNESGELALDVEIDVTNRCSCDMPMTGFDGQLLSGSRVLFTIAKCPSRVLPAGATTTVKIPVRVNLVQGQDAILHPGKLRVTGNLKLLAPDSLRDMLLGRKGR